MNKKKDFLKEDIFSLVKKHQAISAIEKKENFSDDTSNSDLLELTEVISSRNSINEKIITTPPLQKKKNNSENSEERNLELFYLQNKKLINEVSISLIKRTIQEQILDNLEDKIEKIMLKVIQELTKKFDTD